MIIPAAFIFPILIAATVVGIAYASEKPMPFINTAQLLSGEISIYLDRAGDPTYCHSATDAVVNHLFPLIQSAQSFPAEINTPTHHLIHFHDSTAILVEDHPDLFRIGVKEPYRIPDLNDHSDPAWLFIGDQQNADQIRRRLRRTKP